ncbi:hypothetical protein BJ085DRAFT_36972 [Dimargaris cristalligena]|uniref:Uncharacterized protein n=1 Tax=Dimargaris cristalligena TaxID=215637 RepID=A0A4V1J409_9FUNG|nr:hypothetical protein BJ085DRAFT_36972 [Dimargaris cristalligena]|eukprot:RKP33919.1 hypothetical protein BJ085DRAFT_36972 [Dimargaris cristalligena]
MLSDPNTGLTLWAAPQGALAIADEAQWLWHTDDKDGPTRVAEWALTQAEERRVKTRREALETANTTPRGKHP